MASKRVFVRVGELAIPVGELIISIDGKRETSSFKYDASWLDDPRAFALSPGLALTDAPYFFSGDRGSALPPPIGDGTPDSWGRAVIKATLGGRACSELDFLLHSTDFLRSGALRFYESRDADAPALAQHSPDGTQFTIPRLIDLEKFIIEARAFEADPARYREKRADLVSGGRLGDVVGTLGGARPKINAIDNGNLWIVKLAKMNDQYSVAHGEVLALNLAKAVGINACEATVLPSSQTYPVAMVRRFDRTGEGARRPYISAQTFMELPGAEAGNYADIAFQMNEWSADPVSEKAELFRRVAFNILIQNTDDHLRNLGFLYGGNGKWLLSPTFDINPVPEIGSSLKTAVSEIHGTELSIANLIDAAPYFDIDTDKAAEVLYDMAATIASQWRREAAKIKMSGADIRYLTPAFDNSQVEDALMLKTKSGKV
ncbi:type II toxin-antitoxin system HipA family toxin [Thalassospira xiamenensis]|uniref:Serine/threonine-protein kinase HipA n=1 Tax=Thalassospira xiamenensis TaxID=220697 RepID=A0A285TXK7_9PROT|nr:type II toxin-antitoxin system HipA family toxin [Thalassospira xiamenensis]SOC30542.1 serine/threonine-protein kinase HipA [Thalassospira xiamenensis]